MGSPEVQGDLWGRAPEDWSRLQAAQASPLWEAMLDAARVTTGSRVLDAGCGSGGASLLAATRGAVVSGLDASEGLLEFARRSLPEGDFRMGDLEALPFADDMFDSVIAASSLQYAVDRVAALKEFKRVCRPDGRVAVGLWSTPDKVEYRVVFESVRDALPEPPPGDGPFGLSGPGTLEGLIESAGMEVQGAGEALCRFVFVDEDEFWLGVMSAGPQQAAGEIVGEADLREAVVSAAEPYRTEDGGFLFENFFRYVTARAGE